MNLKEELYNQCLNYVQSRMDAAQQGIDEAQQASKDDTKSSAGDKYETGRAMMQQQTEAGAPMPCKGTMPSCMTQVGCVFLVSLPAFPDLSLFTATEWTSVAYSLSSQFLEGRSIKPALGPPISRA